MSAKHVLSLQVHECAWCSAYQTWKLEGFSYSDIRTSFHQIFHKAGLTDKTIHTLVNKFKHTGTVATEPGQGHPSTSDNSIEAIRASIEHSPKLVCRLSRELSILHWRFIRCCVSCWRRSHTSCRFFTMCIDLLTANEDRNILAHVLFSDEATFHICGKVNRHNCRIWANTLPVEHIEFQRDSPKVNVWMGITCDKVYGPFFFAKDTINRATYLDMLTHFLLP